MGAISTTGIGAIQTAAIAGFETNDGRELFGAGTQLENGQRAGHGYAAMAALDSNADGKLSAADAKFGELKVWVDANHDGKTDAGELKGLIDAGVIEIDLNFALGDHVDNGNLLGMTSQWTAADGSKHEVANVWFTKQVDAAPALGDLLADAPAELRGSEGASAGSTGRGAPAMAAVSSHRASLDDELRMQSPLL